MKYRLLIAGCLVGVLIELFICNASFWFTMNSVPHTLTENETIEEAATFTYELDGVNVKDIEVDIDNPSTIAIRLSDRGNANAYELAPKEIDPRYKQDHYLTIHAYGEVASLEVVLTPFADTPIHVGRIAINAPIPLFFSWPRVLCFWSVILFLFALRKRGGGVALLKKAVCVMSTIDLFSYCLRDVWVSCVFSLEHS